MILAVESVENLREDAQALLKEMDAAASAGITELQSCETVEAEMLILYCAHSDEFALMDYEQVLVEVLTPRFNCWQGGLLLFGVSQHVLSSISDFVLTLHHDIFAKDYLLAAEESVPSNRQDLPIDDQIWISDQADEWANDGPLEAFHDEMTEKICNACKQFRQERMDHARELMEEAKLNDWDWFYPEIPGFDFLPEEWHENMFECHPQTVIESLYSQYQPHILEQINSLKTPTFRLNATKRIEGIWDELMTAWATPPMKLPEE